jgi:hypothetical protein
MLKLRGIDENEIKSSVKTMHFIAGGSNIRFYSN